MSKVADRVKWELDELEIKIYRLQEFIQHNDVFKSLPENEKDLMVRQLDIMWAYAYILKERIALLELK